MTTVRYYMPHTELPDGICAGCRTSALTAGREKCQACGVAEALACAPQTAVAYRGLSHAQPGHMCVLPGTAQRRHQQDRAGR
jgi:hypothetical protein